MSERLNVLQRLNLVQQAVSYIQKERKQGMRYNIVSHDAVTASVRPHLVEHGVLYYPVAMTRAQVGNRVEMDLTVRFVAIDDASDFIDVVTCGYGIDDSDKGPGKSISYGVKYALLKALGLETGDDPDQDQDSRHKPAPPPPRPPAPGPRSVERGTPIADARREIDAGTASTVPQNKPAAGRMPMDLKAWAASADALDFLRGARADLGLVVTGADMGRWMQDFRWQHDAIIEFGEARGKDGRTRAEYLNDLIGEAQDRCRANALPADGLRGAA